MSFQKNEQSDLDFSVIDKKSTQQAKLNFSVESLLEEHSQSKIRKLKQEETDGNEEQIIMDGQQNQQIHYVNADNGSFMKDLQKLEDQLSFQTELYNVYQDETSMINSLNPLTKSNLHAKSNSNLKTTKQQSNNQSIDDYGYLVIDFASLNKRKKSSRLEDLSKITHKHDKLHTHQRTVSSHKLKLSSCSSNGLLENSSHQKVAAQKCVRSKSKSKSIESMALGKLLSPPRIGKQKSTSKQKTVVKGMKTKQKNQCKQPTIRLQKSPNIVKTLSKSKSPSKTLLTAKSSKNTNHSSTTIQSIKTSHKSYTKSSNREENAYSDYYGFEDIGESQRLVMKSNCIYTKSQKCVKSPITKKVIGTIKSNSKCKKTVHSPSPSNKDLTMRFKKKKTIQII